MPLDMEHDLAGLRGAEYNPRAIADADIEALAESLRELGCVKPLIARGDVLVAGHQRCRAMRRLGWTTAPVYLLSEATTVYDEVRFNQLHNGTDLDAGDEQARIDGGFPADAFGFHLVEPGRIRGNLRSTLAPVRAEIAALVCRYGPWGAVVATRSGDVVHCAQYALASAMTRSPLLCYVIADEDAERYRARLSRTYGTFSYAHLPRATWAQTFAQMFRLREGSASPNLSEIYDRFAVPFLRQNPDARLLDVGSGQGDYARRLRKQGYRVDELEFFRRLPGRDAVDVDAVQRMVDAALAQLRAGGYDAVVCDCVLNSVDCLDAERAVMRLLNVFVRMGGEVYFSGRPVEAIRYAMQTTRWAPVAKKRAVEFLDNDNFTAIYRKGLWFYQKFHTAEQVEALFDVAGLERVAHVRKLTTSWQAHGRKVRELPLSDALDAVAYEFDLPLGPDRRLGRHEDAKAAVLASRAIDRSEALG